MDLKSHWNKIYKSKTPSELTWFQSEPSLSLKLIELSGIPKTSRVIDVGGGASFLTKRLLEQGYARPAVLDISGESISKAKSLVGDKAAEVEWYEADITRWQPPVKFDLWHDRAVFHFLTDEKDRHLYIDILKQALAPDGYIIIATFAIAGPPKCSGLDVVRYDSRSIRAELGNEFRLIETQNEMHLTPSCGKQKFSYFLIKRQT
ncbi:MAG: class I SAM-dependent methyltransferase [candidate division Zixibacteria bacterium]|nr:class I SAM-dependent methyltransferase [candidate division Zixibacteria bacterium]